MRCKFLSYFLLHTCVSDLNKILFPQCCLLEPVGVASEGEPGCAVPLHGLQHPEGRQGASVARPDRHLWRSSCWHHGQTDSQRILPGKDGNSWTVNNMLLILVDPMIHLVVFIFPCWLSTARWRSSATKEQRESYETKRGEQRRDVWHQAGNGGWTRCTTKPLTGKRWTKKCSRKI